LENSLDSSRNDPGLDHQIAGIDERYRAAPLDRQNVESDFTDYLARFRCSIPDQTTFIEPKESEVRDELFGGHETNQIGSWAQWMVSEIARPAEWLGHANVSTTRLYDRRKSKPEDSPTLRVKY
jgi:hypothetical protein